MTKKDLLQANVILTFSTPVLRACKMDGFHVSNGLQECSKQR